MDWHSPYINIIMECETLKVLHLFEFVLAGHVNFVARDGINETIFEVGKSLVGENLYAPAILKLPFALEGYDALFDIRIHERMDIQAELLDGQLTR